jgi:hypothetical protein
MLSSTAGWLLAVGSITVLWAYLLIRQGPRVALGAAMVLSFAFPVWIRMDIAGLPFNVRTAVAAIAMLGYSLHPRGKIILPLTLLDFCMALMCIAHVTADTFAEGFTATLPLRAWGEWILPYIAGRYAIQSRDDLKTVAPWAVGVLVFIAIAAVFEALTKVNPFEVAFGDRPVELSKRTLERLGLKRAFGPTTHAIYFGMLMAMLMPWLVCLWQSFESRRIQALTVAAGIIALAGAVSTVSRTPMITVLAASGLVAALQYRFLRWPTGLSMILAALVFLIFPIQVTDALSRWTGGGDKVRLIEVDGRAVEYSGSRSRLLILPTYSEALMKAGPTGFGSEALATFPPKIPYLAGTAALSDSMKIIDNGYVVLTLRFGWLGGCCLVLLLFTAIVTGLSLYRQRPDQLLPATLACLLVVVAGFSLLLVSMNYDFGLPMLWTIGVLSGLMSAITRHRLERIPAFR